MARLDPKRRETLRSLIVATLGSGEDDDLIDGLMDICEQAFRTGVKHGEEARRRAGQDAVVKMRARREQTMTLVRKAVGQYKAEAQRLLLRLRRALEDRAGEHPNSEEQDHRDEDDKLWGAADRELQQAARLYLRSLQGQIEETDEAALSDASRELVRPSHDTEDLLPELKLIRSGQYAGAAAGALSKPVTSRAIPTPHLQIVESHPTELQPGRGSDPTGGDPPE